MFPRLFAFGAVQSARFSLVDSFRIEEFPKTCAWCLTDESGELKFSMPANIGFAGDSVILAHEHKEKPWSMFEGWIFVPKTADVSAKLIVIQTKRKEDPASTAIQSHQDVSAFFRLREQVAGAFRGFEPDDIIMLWATNRPLDVGADKVQEVFAGTHGALFTSDNIGTVLRLMAHRHQIE
eukprot:TRINITY_DN15494_c0_g1_i1.p1 TRINITY_DN15494_c0_g1~~TRINITY_DN15494_c0_g1_i1.p1  ORF type:complete len:197 (-),score=28.98 TRINITY_DN15494_c0_g1_i1:27-566(-)